MLPSAGFFRGVNCPFFASGLCHRPYCHFKHAKQKERAARPPPSVRDDNVLIEEGTDGKQSTHAQKSTVGQAKGASRVLHGSAVSVAEKPAKAVSAKPAPVKATDEKKTSADGAEKVRGLSAVPSDTSTGAKSTNSPSPSSSSTHSLESNKHTSVVVVPDLAVFSTSPAVSSSKAGDDVTDSHVTASDDVSHDVVSADLPLSPTSSSASFSPPPSPPMQDDGSGGEEEGESGETKRSSTPLPLLSYDTRPEDFMPRYPRYTPAVETSTDADTNADNDSALDVDSGEPPLDFSDSFDEPAPTLDLQDLLNAYSTRQDDKDDRAAAPFTESSSSKRKSSVPAVLSSGLNVLPGGASKKSKVTPKPEGGKSAEKKNKLKKKQTNPLEEREAKFEVQDAMAAEGRMKRRQAHTGAAAVHLPRGRSGNVPLRRRPVSAGMPTSAVSTAHEPPANLKPGQGFDNDIYSSVVKKRKAHPTASGSSGSPTTNGSAESGAGNRNGSGAACTSSFYPSGGNRAPDRKPPPVKRPSLPLHVGGKIPRNVRQGVLHKLFDLYVAQGMDVQEAHDKVLVEEEVITKRSTSRSLYNNMVAVKLGRLRSQLPSSSPLTGEQEQEVDVSSRNANSGLFKKSSATRIAATPALATVAYATSMARTSQPVAAGSTATASNSVFASPDQAVSLHSHTRDGVPSSSVSSKAKSISARNMSPSLVAALQDLKSIHDKSEARQSRPMKRKIDDSDDLVRLILPSSNRPQSRTPGLPGSGAMKIPKVQRSTSLGESEKPSRPAGAAPSKSSTVNSASSQRVASSNTSSSRRPSKVSRGPMTSVCGPMTSSSLPPSSAALKVSSTGHNVIILNDFQPLALPAALAMTPAATKPLAPATPAAVAPKPAAKQTVPEELSEEQFFSYLTPYLATEKQMLANGYPQETSNPDEALVPHVEGRSKPHPPQILTDEDIRYYCSRCGKPFVVKRSKPYQTESCSYHFGRKHKHRESGVMVASYSCCSSDGGGSGCQVAKWHVWDGRLPSHMPLPGYVSTQPASRLTLSSLRTNSRCCVLLSAEALTGARPRVVAFDCEMSYTTIGLSLTRITAVDLKNNILMDTLVSPRAPIVDCNTRFSGVTEKDLDGVTTRLEDVQEVLTQLISSDTILLGHSLESDLKAVKMIHHRIVDTALVFPHRLGPPYKKALKTLAAEKLNHIIQESDSGHNSAEDAIIAMELMLQKVKDDIRKSSRRASTVLVRPSGF